MTQDRMTKEPEQDRDRDEPGREPYTPPRLDRHGTIEALTRGAAGLTVIDPNSGL
jgi:hypothetical protein